MSKISFQPNAVGSGTFTIASPNSGTNRTLTLPDITGTMVSTDTSGNVGVSGTLTATGFQGPTGGLVSMQAFTSSGTWTKPAGVTKIKVYVTGGGGGGCATNSDDLAAGGGAGSTAIKIIDVSSVSSVSVTVGAGQAARGNNGGNSVIYGNASSFGSYCTAAAGANGGGQWSLGGNGGTASGGDININGGDGQGGMIDVTIYQWVTGGTGGASYWGGGGRGANTYSPSLKRDGQAYGSGGGGGAYNTAGGTGAGGIVVVEEYM